ncbi:hypothetical protein AX774_g1754 [Zancudomyces culisetae]|uniref:L-seryl-tRNA(Sec) kinase n=1 Tax=Zancudomyces culisetae TaxID=1213189 RepID=A0A1R1PUU1_ZANCU|nr:hypothetical protein AX774_g1754 [Zancudomyces culisetae]|eukprot:OMH84707.1 hypothetical protein AX774_g1754 [Zancudomyces culisetae]
MGTNTVLVVLVFGQPGAGKTTLSKGIQHCISILKGQKVSDRRKNGCNSDQSCNIPEPDTDLGNAVLTLSSKVTDFHLSCHVYNFDELLPNWIKPSANKADQTENLITKESRKDTIGKLANKGYKNDRDQLMNHIFNDINARNAELGKDFAEFDSKARNILVFLVDDVFQYYSMRKSYYKRAQSNGYIFMQIFVDCDRKQRYERNKARGMVDPELKMANSTEIPEHVMNSLSTRFQQPCIHEKSWWEKKYTLHIDTSKVVATGQPINQQTVQNTGILSVSGENLRSDTVEVQSLICVNWMLSNYQTIGIEQSKRRFSSECNKQQVKCNQTTFLTLHEVYNILKMLVGKKISKYRCIDKLQPEPGPDDKTSIFKEISLEEYVKLLNSVKSEAYAEIKRVNSHSSGLSVSTHDSVYSIFERHHSKTLNARLKPPTTPADSPA